MVVPSQTIVGHVAVQEGRALLILNGNAELFLRFALTELGSGARVLPESILDDWGKEIKALAIYEWLNENGTYFPRAELFGYYLDGSPVQRFIREFDLTSGYQVYVYKNAGAPLSHGVNITDCLVHSDRIKEPKLSSPVIASAGLLDGASVRWWLADVNEADQISEIMDYGQ